MVSRPGPAPVDPTANAVAIPRAPALDFREVYAAHAPFVWRTVRRLGVRAPDVNDVTQEVFLVVHRKLGEYDGRASVRAWIFGIAHRCASDHRRRRYVRREALVDAPDEAAVEPSQPEAVDRREARALLDAALDRLDDDKRAVFVLHLLEQLPMTEVASLVGCPLQTAYSRLYAAQRNVVASIEQRLQGQMP